VGNDGIATTLADVFRAENFAGEFDFFFEVPLDAVGIVFLAEGFGVLVAVALEVEDLAGESAEGPDGAREFIGIGSELLSGLGFKEVFGEFGGGELEADFGELGGLGGAEVFGEVVLAEAVLDSAVLLGAPVAIAAAGFPIGDVALGDVVAVFAEGIFDSGMGNIVAEHAVDHVAFEVGEAGDFAIPNFGRECAGGGRLHVAG
jgi:hypothetical protein